MADVDPARMVVRSPNAVFAFEADCGAGTAIFDADGSPVRLRLMRWGEKCGLARFAASGPALVEDQLLRLCAAPEADAERRHALLSLILWLHAPLDLLLPFDEQLLARVTLDLCRALGWQAAAIAESSAPAVEALWRALPQTAESKARDSEPDVTRIVVIPDEAPSIARSLGTPLSSAETDASASAEARVSAGSRPSAAGLPRTASTAGTEPQAPVVTAPTSDVRHDREPLVPSAPPQRSLRQAKPRFALRHSGQPKATPAISTPAGARQTSATAAADATTLAPSSVSQAADMAAIRADLRNHDPIVQTSGPPAPFASDAFPSVPIAGRTGPDLRPDRIAPAAVRYPVTASGADPMDPRLARVVAAVSRAAPILQPPTDPEPLLDTFADNLEAAARELGIAMGD